MNLTAFKEIAEVTVTRFADSPLGKMTESKSFDKPMSEYDIPLGEFFAKTRSLNEEERAYYKEKLGLSDSELDKCVIKDGEFRRLLNEEEHAKLKEGGMSDNNLDNCTVDEDVGFQENNADNLDIQKEVCNDVENNGNIDEMGNLEKGNYGEMKTDIAMSEEGWSRISDETVTSLEDTGHKGIDGVYERENDETGETEFCIVESKYGSSQLGETEDGKQMSENWIDKRLDDAVGKEKADEIRERQIEDPDSVTSRLSHIDSEGNVEFTELDSDGNPMKE